MTVSGIRVVLIPKIDASRAANIFKMNRTADDPFTLQKRLMANPYILASCLPSYSEACPVNPRGSFPASCTN